MVSTSVKAAKTNIFRKIFVNRFVLTLVCFILSKWNSLRSIGGGYH